MRKNKSKVCFVESSFRQTKSSVNISLSTVPHCVPLQKWRHCCLITKNKYK